MTLNRCARWIPLLFCFVVTFFPADAAAAAPVLKSANITITPHGASTAVREQLTLNGLAGSKSVTGLLYSYPQAVVEGLSWTLNGSALQPQAARRGVVTRYSFAAPSTGSATIDLRYTVRDQGSFRVPLFVPDVLAQPGTRTVAITFSVPSGSHLQGDSFPYVANQTARTVRLNLEDIPSFTRFHYAAAKPGFLTTDALISGIVIVVMLLVILAWALTERQAMRKGDVGV